MAYEVTATRRRPQRFENLVGQEFVAQTMENSINAGRIAHAYLFSGPRGCGKTSTARILAKALNCAKGPTASPCGECQACKEITAGSSLDVIEIDGASNNSVDNVRQIKDEVLFPPNSCRYKVYIIDEVHMLSTSAFNALLKTIEEPPPYVVFIFATTELQKVPMTIKSRCQQFNFRLVPVEKVKEQLAAAAQELGIKADDEALYWIARESGGSMRDSYTLFDQVAAFSGDEMTYTKIRDKLGLVGVDRLNELFGLCVAGKSSEALTKLDEYMQNGVSVEQLISNCADYLRSLLLIKSGVTKEALLGHNVAAFSQEVLEAWSSVQVERAIDIFMKLYRDIRYSLNTRYEMELAISRLTWLREYVSPAEVKKALDGIKPLLAKSAAAAAVPAGTNAGMADGGASGQGGIGWTPPFRDGGAEPPVNNSAKSLVAEQPTISTRIAEAPLPQLSRDMSRGAAGTEATVAPLPQLSRDTSRGAAGTGTTAVTQFQPDQGAPAAQMPTDVTQSQPDKAAPVVPSSPELPAAQPAPVAPINPEELFRAMIQEFSATDGLLSAALSESVSHRIDSGSLEVTVASPFAMMQLKSRAGDIAAYVERRTGRKLTFDVRLEERKETQKAEIQLPIQVEILRDTFKGSVLGM
ncbi:MAG: DNA polymerase III subunit gamma/tau [Treponema sp.]|nr:DNA polymerase III subunit gamma/tau [Treponema sp.]